MEAGNDKQRVAEHYKIVSLLQSVRLKPRKVTETARKAKKARTTVDSKKTNQKKKKIAARGKIYFYFRENKFLSLSAFGVRWSVQRRCGNCARVFASRMQYTILRSKNVWPTALIDRHPARMTRSGR